MKNFKKVLALVLAVVMLVSFATVASAKTVTSSYYKDSDKIDYTEAVDVLGSIGVLNGYPDDTFQPNGTITRAEAAKIIAIFDNQSPDISKLYASANPFADCVGNWAESFIAYGVKTGIIAGRNATTFDPNGNVTGVEFLKMALVVLGYDAKVEGLEGKNWDVNTLALAKRVGLTASLGNKFEYANSLKRQEAAVIMLDALRADVVEYGSKLGFNGKFDDEDGWPYITGGTIYWTVSGAVSTGDKLGKGWKLTESTDIDEFYRPYSTWLLNGKEIGRYMFKPLAEYHIAYNGCDVLVDLGVAKTNTTKAIKIDNHYINGFEVTPNQELELKHTKETVADGECKAKEKLESGAQGTLTQVFYVDGGYRITEIDTWLGRVTEAKRVSSNRDGHLSYYTESTIYAYDTTIDGTDKNDHDRCIGEYEITTTAADGLSKGDFVLFTYSLKRDVEGIVDIDVTKAVAGTFNGYKYNNYPSKTRVDGTYIPDAAHFHLGYDDSKTNDFGAKRFFFDVYGNVIGMIDPAGADTDYLVIDKLWVDHDDEGDAVLYADVVGLDAKISKKVVVASAANFDAEWFASQNDREYAFKNAAWYNKLREFYINNDKQYVISDEKGTEIGDVRIVKGDAEVCTTANFFDFAIDSATQFLIKEDDGSYTAVTGFRNIDSMTASNGWYIDENNDDIAEIVYLYNVVREGSKVVAYVTMNPTTWEEVDENGESYYVMTVYVKGVATDLYFTDAEFATFESEGAGFYEFQYKNVGKHNYVTISQTPSDLDDANAEYTVNVLNGNILKYTDASGDTHYDAVADDVAFYSIRYAKTVEIEKADYSAMVVGSKVHLTFNAAGEIAEIYVIETIEY